MNTKSKLTTMFAMILAGLLMSCKSLVPPKMEVVGKVEGLEKLDPARLDDIRADQRKIAELERRVAEKDREIDALKQGTAPATRTTRETVATGKEISIQLEKIKPEPDFGHCARIDIDALVRAVNDSDAPKIQCRLKWHVTECDRSDPRNSSIKTDSEGQSDSGWQTVHTGKPGEVFTVRGDVAVSCHPIQYGGHDREYEMCSPGGFVKEIRYLVITRRDNHYEKAFAKMTIEGVPIDGTSTVR